MFSSALEHIVAIFLHVICGRVRDFFEEIAKHPQMKCRTWRRYAKSLGETRRWWTAEHYALYKPRLIFIFMQLNCEFVRPLFSSLLPYIITYIDTHLDIHIQIYEYIHVYMYMYICVYIHTYTCTHTQTTRRLIYPCIHMYLHICCHFLLFVCGFVRDLLRIVVIFLYLICGRFATSLQIGRASCRERV